MLFWLLMANARSLLRVDRTTLDNDLRILLPRRHTLRPARRPQAAGGQDDCSSRATSSGRSPGTRCSRSCTSLTKQGGAQDWQSGLNLSLTHSGKWHYLNFHHIFPKSRLASAGYETSAINEIANMAFISGSLNRALSNKEPNEYFPGVIEKRGPEALSGQLCIPLDAALLEVANYRAFLETRRAALHQDVERILRGNHRG